MDNYKKYPDNHIRDMNSVKIINTCPSIHYSNNKEQYNINSNETVFYGLDLHKWY